MSMEVQRPIESTNQRKFTVPSKAYSISELSIVDNLNTFSEQHSSYKYIISCYSLHFLLKLNANIQ